MKSPKIAAIIPAYKVSAHVLDVIAKVGSEVQKIYVVDDACPAGSGKLVQSQCKDPRVSVLFSEKNHGVGGATLKGFAKATSDGNEILVKLDGDGQMDPALILRLVRPIVLGKADYAKGSRFHSPANLKGMPALRLLGNAGLSFLAKMASGHWSVMDPTNGFVALHSSLLPLLETEKISSRYFFENDMLFRLGLIQAAVQDVPMKASYGDEKSSLNVFHCLITFPAMLAVRTGKRIFYRYFLRDFNVGTLLFLAGSALFFGGVAFGGYHWWKSIESGQVASSGTVMLAALPTMLGFQMLAFALLFDIMNSPREPIHPYLDTQDVGN